MNILQKYTLNDKNNGDILFKGQYLNGKRNGYGDEYKYINNEKNNTINKFK